MKKVLLVTLASLIVFNNRLISCAETCETPQIDKEEINFSKIVRNLKPWDKVNFDDKKIDLVRYEALPSLKPNLDNDIKTAAKKYAYEWNNKITLKKALNAADFLTDLITGVFGIESEKVKNTIENLRDYMKSASELSDEEVQNKLDSMRHDLIASSSKSAVSSSAISLGVSAATGGAVWAGTALVKKAAIAKTVIDSAAVANAATSSAATATGAVAASSAVVPAVVVLGTVGIAVGIGALLLLAHSHNNESEKDEAKAMDDLIRSMEKYKRVKDSIFRHDWIDNNVLVMASSTVSDCPKVNVQFLNVEGIEYKQDSVNDYVAISKCQFMEDNTPSCWSKILNEIQCILKAGSRLLCVNDGT